MRTIGIFIGIFFFTFAKAQETNPDGYIGKPSVIIGGGTDLSSSIETKTVTSDSAVNRLEFQGWVASADILLPLSQSFTFQLGINYDRPTINYFSTPTIKDPYSRREGYRLRIMTYLRFYP